MVPTTTTTDTVLGLPLAELLVKLLKLADNTDNLIDVTTLHFTENVVTLAATTETTKQMIVGTQLFISDGTTGHTALEGNGITRVVNASGVLYKFVDPAAPQTPATSAAERTSLINAFRESNTEFAAPDEEIYTAFIDFEAERFSDTTLVSKYIPPGTPTNSRTGQYTQDEYNYDYGVLPELYADGAQSKFEEYHEAIQNYNALIKAANWYDTQPGENKGKVRLGIPVGLTRIWGRENRTGLNSGMSFVGSTTTTHKVIEVQFGTSSRGSEWSEATLILDEGDELHDNIVVGMAYGTADITSSDTDWSTSTKTRIVNDDVAFANGGHIITSIAADRLSFTVDVPHREGSTVQLVGNTVHLTNTVSGFEAGLITIPHSQIAFVGGFDGRADEAWIRPQYGSKVEYESIAFVDHTDPSITRDNNYAPDRKNMFAANIADLILKSNVVLAGAEGHVLRVAKLVRLSANRSFFGAAGLHTRAGRTTYCQVLCLMDLTRCGTSGGLDYGYIIASTSFASIQASTTVNSLFGVSVSNLSLANFQNSLAYGCGTGLYVAAGSRILTDSNTVIENCSFGQQIREDSNILEFTPPKMIGNTTDVLDQREHPSEFKSDVVIDKIDPRITFLHGSIDSWLTGSVGAFGFVTNSTARDVTFGPKTQTDLFVMDTGAKTISIDGQVVADANGAVIGELKTNLTINKSNPELLLKHGASTLQIRSELGSLHVETNSTAADVVFGTKTIPGIFILDMGTKSIVIDGDKVLGVQQGAIPDGEDATVNSILAALRAHGIIAT